jgi:hypothetical protein
MRCPPAKDGHVHGGRPFTRSSLYRMPGGRGQLQPLATEGPSDQRQLLRDCVARIDYDGTTAEVAITLKALGSSQKESA